MWKTEKRFCGREFSGLRRRHSGKESASNARDSGSTLGPGRSPGGGNGNPLQYSCLGNSMNRGAWWVTVHEVTKSQTGLWLSMHTQLEVYITFIHILWVQSSHGNMTLQRRLGNTIYVPEGSRRRFCWLTGWCLPHKFPHLTRGRARTGTEVFLS